MRFLLLLGLAGCTASPTPAPSDPPAAAAADQAHAAVAEALAAWEAGPGPETLDAVSLVAAEALEAPPGTPADEVVLARALTHVLLRPDLARPRLAPLVDRLPPEGVAVWLDTLLRDGDLATFASAAASHRGRPVDPDQPALRAAVTQAVHHREVGWREAVYAHDAGTLADRQVDRGREPVGRPLADLPAALGLFPRLFPDHHFEVVLTRSTLPTDGEASLEPGAIPATGGRRRVVAYGAGRRPEDLARPGRALLAARPPRTVGFVVRALGPDGGVHTWCGEGGLREGGLQVVAACRAEPLIAWLEAAEAWSDHQAAGTPEAQALPSLRDRFGARLLASPVPP